MNWYDLRPFEEKIKVIEAFLTEMAANETTLLWYGLRAAYDFPSAEKGMEAMSEFVSEFPRLMRLASATDSSLAVTLQTLESGSNLVEQISLVALRLRMVDAKRPMRRSLPLFFATFIGGLSAKQSLFSEEKISLQRIVISLSRLRAITKLLDEILYGRRANDSEVMRPSNIDKNLVVQLIDAAIADLEGAGTLPAARRAEIAEILRDARTEVLSDRPTWSKAVGALVIVAAITSGLADAPNAIKSVQTAIQHILGTSVTKPSTTILPPPPTTPVEPRLPFTI
jgi:hypothetical protein